jgi:hypothetical protein
MTLSRYKWCALLAKGTPSCFMSRTLSPESIIVASILKVQSFEDCVIARVLDFLGARVSWHRGLWNVGLVLTLKEVLEASEAVHAGVLTGASLRNLSSSAMALAGPDPAVGSQKQKELLQKSLRSEITFQSVEYYTIEQIAKDVEDNYLQRWEKSLTSQTSRIRPERVARSITSHMLDAGFNTDFLHRWWTLKTRTKGASALEAIIAAAHSLVHEKPKEYAVLVAFESMPEGKGGMPGHWVENVKVSEWLHENGFDVRNLRQNGGLWLKLQARDPSSAVDSAVEIVERIAARVAIGKNTRLMPTPWAWVKGQKHPFPFRRRRRGVEVHALYRENQLYSDQVASNVDGAIELVAPLVYGSPSAAVAGGWAAIEALLSSPGEGERVGAADRMASIVACSFPRAELTMLSYKLVEAGDPLSVQLKTCANNRERAIAVAEAIVSRQVLTLSQPSDVAALARVSAILQDVYCSLRDIETHISVAFRRLYRLRNIVLHWGRTDAVALRAGLRTAAPLVGAGLDRIAHGWFVEKLTPLELIARARVRLHSCEGSSCVDLLC